MEGALNEMRENIGRKDGHQKQAIELENRWVEFKPYREQVSELFEDLGKYQKDSQTKSEAIVVLSKQMKQKIKGFNSQINSCKIILISVNLL